MEKKLDTIYEAYMGDMSKEFTQKVRERIHWICSQANGETVLDIGCSQGITSILLGAAGKVVLALDVEQDSIDFANERLKEKEVGIQQRIKFVKSDFIEYDFGNITFDTIVMTEVLEHIIDVDVFLKKASQLLSENGRLIVTVPFGINDFWDHKRTYYTGNLYEQLIRNYFSVQHIEFFSKWIGFVCVKGIQSGVCPDLELMKKEEDNFYLIERRLVDQNKALKEKILNMSNQLEQSNDDKKRQKAENIHLKEYISTLNAINAEKIHAYTVQKNDCELMIEQLQQTLLEKDKLMTETLLEKDKRIAEVCLKYRELSQSQMRLKDMYKALAESKLGKITLKYWALKKKISKG